MEKKNMKKGTANKHICRRRKLGDQEQTQKT
jgi:hypothetical protein